MVDLNEFVPPGSGWTNLEAAVAINDAGQISGYGQFADGVFHAFLLTPAPPLTVTLSDAARTGTSFSFSFGTQPGHSYAGQFTAPLLASNTWMTFTNLAGDGSFVRVTDHSATNNQRFYRVVTQ